MTVKEFQAVIFDFHSTLVDNGNPKGWLIKGLRRRATHSSQDPNVSLLTDAELLEQFEEEIKTAHLGTDRLEKRPRKKRDNGVRHTTVDEFLTELNKIWEIAKELDPKSQRDLDPEHHRRVFDEIMEAYFDIELDLSHALYESLTDNWIAYTDSKPMLQALKNKGVKLGLVSNVGFDIRPVLKREGLMEFFDEILLSCEIGECKPSKNVFLTIMDRLGVKHDECLMVGDDAHADGAAAILGIRTLILPRTHGPVHGLELVTRLV